MNHIITPDIRKIPLFSNLKADVLQSLGALAKVTRYPKNTIILHQGDSSHSLFIILTGKVRVYVCDGEKELVLQIQEAGSFFGELALLTDEPRSASVKTLEKTDCAIIAQNDFRVWLASSLDGV